MAGRSVERTVLSTVVISWALSNMVVSLHGPHGVQDGGLSYCRDFLLQWSTLRASRDYFSELFPPEAILGTDDNSDNRDNTKYGSKPRKRGKRGGVRLRLERQKLNRFPLLTMILANAQSLKGKTDELQAAVRYQHEYREDACLMAFTET
ncbi:hypothetical protein BaRGS_00028503 [Batillaria attramentaria]|uniref:Uncharacterized protein n=1 Tax=Batillaria attramentaria TaxID=370345 RepID=A0ABD0JZT4_9CAEN